ncbi:hypothetical protein ACFQ0X_00325 [Streptomyces rectiviolaceus]
MTSLRLAQADFAPAPGNARAGAAAQLPEPVPDRADQHFRRW